MLTFPQALALIPAPAPRPALKAPCDECDGCGRLAHGNPLDPATRTSQCGACHGEGEVDATCQICGGNDPAVEVIRCPGDLGPWLACEACVAANTDDVDAKIAAFDAALGMHTRGIILDYLEASTGMDLATMQVRS